MKLVIETLIVLLLVFVQSPAETTFDFDGIRTIFILLDDISLELGSSNVEVELLE